jgi:hypothetical protein
MKARCEELRRPPARKKFAVRWLEAMRGNGKKATNGNGQKPATLPETDKADTAEITPATGARAQVLDLMSEAAFAMIKIVEQERSGIRDGDGTWHGHDVMADMAREMAEVCFRLLAMGAGSTDAVLDGIRQWETRKEVEARSRRDIQRDMDDEIPF